jgi:hypothetical protein
MASLDGLALPGIAMNPDVVADAGDASRLADAKRIRPAITENTERYFIAKKFPFV